MNRVHRIKSFPFPVIFTTTPAHILPPKPHPTPAHILPPSPTPAHILPPTPTPSPPPKPQNHNTKYCNNRYNEILWSCKKPAGLKCAGALDKDKEANCSGMCHKEPCCNKGKNYDTDAGLTWGVVKCPGGQHQLIPCDDETSSHKCP